jgi:sugar phosphate isomerase/epimerase
MLDAVPGIGLKYDPSFSAQAGRSYVDEIIRYGEVIKHIHVKSEIVHGRTTDFANGIIPHRYVPAGMGNNINWGSVIALLYEIGYQGDIAIEPHSQYWVDNLERNLIISKRHLDQFIAL